MVILRSYQENKKILMNFKKSGDTLVIVLLKGSLEVPLILTNKP